MKILADVDGDGSPEYEYQLKLVRDITIQTKEESTTLPLPGTSADSSFIQAFQGESEELTISFNIYNDNTDKANETAPQGGPFADTIDDSEFNADGTAHSVDTDDVVTLQEQVKYLQDYIKQPNISAEHQFEGYPLLDGDFKKGRLVEVNPRVESGSPAHIPCDIRLIVGNVL